MRKITNENLAELLMQLRFAPQKQRQKQLDSAEKLLAIIEKDKQYPFDFVCFKITGYRPKASVGRQLVEGVQLFGDLLIFISKLSGQLDSVVAEQKQKVYTVEELAESLGVSTKTISRWREKGLVARRFVFDDGKKRLGFLQSAVDKFLNANPNLVQTAKAFTRITKKQKQWIIKRAIVLAAQDTMTRHQIINQIASQIGRAHETVRTIILAYEKANPNKRIFKKPAGVIKPTQAAEIYKLFKAGATIEELMKCFNRTRSSIYRIINQRRAKEILARKIEFIASDEFLEKDARERILTQPTDLPELTTPKTKSFKLATRELPEYLQSLTDAPVLNRERETELFRRYNFLKYLVCITRAGIRPTSVSSTRLREIESYVTEAENIKKAIIEANLGLVVTIASKHATSGASMPDLVSEGNLSLMRAVEKFDYTRGFRFATYASWAIAKDFAHKIPADTARLDKATVASLANVQRDLRAATAAGVASIERARRSLIHVIKDNLDEREQYIILNHFGLVGPPIKKKKKTLKQIGDDLDLSKERVRQIELVALQKLKHFLSIEEFELLKG